MRTLAVGAFQENCHVLVDTAARRAVLVDPGAEPERLLAALREDDATLEAIWLTHAHVDHVGAIAGVIRRSPVPVYLHPLDRPLYDRAVEMGALFGLNIEPPPVETVALAEGDVVHVGEAALSVMHTPGHAPGHVVFHGHGMAFVGDCLFAGSVGRTDLPLANAPDLVRSLERIAALPDDTRVFSGHGPSTTIGRERTTNPFLTGDTRIVGGG
ncbi:MAG TPA: MBL fold metallo-hydrolase [Gemmatimonadaceae bacterium]|nr:MBL fold metallo-hydrolase [Gemmatimonadaceae bacterium]